MADLTKDHLRKQVNEAVEIGVSIGRVFDENFRIQQRRASLESWKMRLGIVDDPNATQAEWISGGTAAVDAGAIPISIGACTKPCGNIPENRREIAGSDDKRIVLDIQSSRRSDRKGVCFDHEARTSTGESGGKYFTGTDIDFLRSDCGLNSAQCNRSEGRELKEFRFGNCESRGMEVTNEV